MKRSLCLFFASFLAAPLLFAQGNGDVNSPTAQFPGQRPDPIPAPPAPPTPPSSEGIPLIPEIPQAPPVKSAPQAAGQKKNNKPAGPSRTDIAEDAMQLHIKLRAAKTKALEDPVIQAELAKAALAKTDYDRREVYKRYYILLYARMLQIDPSIAAGIAARQGSSLYGCYQYHIRPTVPIDQAGQSKLTGPENALNATGSGGTPPPRRSFGQAKIGSF
jgi:hypothetical protein